MRDGQIRFPRPLSTVLLCACVAVSTPVSGRAQEIFERVSVQAFRFEGLFQGTRTEAMGSADLAGARGVEAQLLNPAPLQFGSSTEVAYGHMEWFEGEAQNYGAQVMWRDLRFALVRNEYRFEDLRVRTAFEPEGRDIDIRERIDVAGLSWARRHTLDSTTRLLLGVGGSYRRYSSHVGSSRTHASTFDAGTTAAVSRLSNGAVMRLLGAVAWQNVFDQNAEVPGGRVSVPRTLRLGLTADVALDLAGEAGEDARIRLAYARTLGLECSDEDDDHYGAEIVILRRLALRAGRDESVGDASTTWGFGLALEEDWTQPFTFFLDWTRVELENEIVDESFDLFGLRVQLNL